MNRAKHLMVLVLGIMAGLYLRSCFHKPALPQSVQNPLPAHVDARIAVQHDVIAVQTKTGTQAHYVPQQGSATVEVKDNGAVQVHVQQFGVSHTPELGLLYSDHVRLLLGMQLAYFDRFEVHGGIGFPNGLIGFLGVGYRLDQVHLENTSLLVSMTTNRDFGLGLLVRF